MCEKSIGRPTLKITVWVYVDTSWMIQIKQSQPPEPVWCNCMWLRRSPKASFYFLLLSFCTSCFEHIGTCTPYCTIHKSWTILIRRYIYGMNYLIAVNSRNGKGYPMTVPIKIRTEPATVWVSHGLDDRRPRHRDTENRCLVLYKLQSDCEEKKIFSICTFSVPYFPVIELKPLGSRINLAAIMRTQRLNLFFYFLGIICDLFWEFTASINDHFKLQKNLLLLHRYEQYYRIEFHFCQISLERFQYLCFVFLARNSSPRRTQRGRWLCSQLCMCIVRLGRIKVCVEP